MKGFNAPRVSIKTTASLHAVRKWTPASVASPVPRYITLNSNLISTRPVCIDIPSERQSLICNSPSGGFPCEPGMRHPRALPLEATIRPLEKWDTPKWRDIRNLSI